MSGGVARDGRTLGFRAMAVRLHVALLFLALAAPQASGHTAWTGHRLVEACASTAGIDPGGDCAVFIRAIVDRYHELLATDCPRVQANFGELVRGVTAFLGHHQAELDREASDLVLDSVKQNYRCAW